MSGRPTAAQAAVLSFVLSCGADGFFASEENFGRFRVARRSLRECVSEGWLEQLSWVPGADATYHLTVAGRAALGAS